MKGESRALANALLERHRTICRPLARHGPADVDDNDINISVTPYGDLCLRVGLGRGFARAVHPFLYEIAQWCDEHGWPPRNALVINAERGYPGDGYNKAPGCHEWVDDVKRVVAFPDYPAHVE